MGNRFSKIISTNPDFSPLYRLISKYIESKYNFLKPRFYDEYMVFSDELNNCPILISTDSSHKRLIIISRYNSLNFVAQPKSIYNCTNFIDSAIRSYNYKKSFKKLEMDYVLSEDKKVLTRTLHKGVAAIYQRRDSKFKRYPNKETSKRNSK